MNIAQILNNTDYTIQVFNKETIETFEKEIFTKDVKGKETPYVKCLVRKKEIKLTPEEVVRQLYLRVLNQNYKYPLNKIAVEVPVQFGSDNSKRADIVVYAKDKDIAYIVVELKKPKAKEGKEQLKSYCNGTGAPIGVWTNGDLIEFFHRKDPNIFDKIDNIPTSRQTLKDIFNERITIAELMQRDSLNEKTLKRIIEEFEDEVLANAGVDVFEEAFKLIFSKLFDEYISGKDKDKINHFFENNPDISFEEFAHYINLFNSERNLDAKERKNEEPKTEKERIVKRFYDNVYKNFRSLEFRNTGAEIETAKQIGELFKTAKAQWKGIFQTDDKIKLTESHLQTCVSYLQDVKLFNSNLEIVDEAFEYLINKDAKGDKGQYFTPRYVIDMCVKMLNPKASEYMIDTAAGSCGFPVHTIFHVWNELNPNNKSLFTTDEKTPEQKEYVRSKVFAIDFDEKAVRVGRTLNLIAGDGETNVLQMNSLDFERWEIDYNNRKDWSNIYGEGFKNLENLKQTKNNGFQHFNFDVLMANPPFAGDIKDKRVIQKYELGKKYETKTVQKGNEEHKLSVEKGWVEKISRDILFLERNLNMLKSGGRMAIVLPQGRFNNSSDKMLRDFIAKHCRILAVVGLHGNTFKPHTGTKTSVLFVQKWDEVLCPKQKDYNIFFATQKVAGKDNSGDKIFETEMVKENGFDVLKQKHDKYGHPIVKHDLFNTDELTNDGIAEAFIEFAKKESLSFF